METIKITPNMVFVLETDTALPDQQKEHLLKQWNDLFPKNHLLIMKKGTMKILDIQKNDSNQLR